MQLSVELQKRLNKLDRTKFRYAGGFRTSSLFRDHPTKAHEDEYCMFYINREVSDEYIALKEIYMQIADPTEYQFAMTVFGSYRHWKQIAKLVWVKPYVEEWREELEIKLKSEAIIGITALADDPEIKETTKLQSLKWLAQSEYAAKKTETQKKKEAKEDRVQMAVVDTVKDDFERLGIQPRSVN